MAFGHLNVVEILFDIEVTFISRSIYYKIESQHQPVESELDVGFSESLEGRVRALARKLPRTFSLHISFSRNPQPLNDNLVVINL